MKCKVLNLECSSLHNGTGWELTGQKRGSQSRTWELWWTKSWTCVSGVPLQQRRLTAYWAVQASIQSIGWGSDHSPHSGHTCSAEEPKTGGNTRQQDRHWHVGPSPGNSYQDGRGLEHLTYKERLKEMRLSSLEKAQSGSSCWLQLRNGKVERRWSLTLLRDGTRSKGHKLIQTLYLYSM